MSRVPVSLATGATHRFTQALSTRTPGLSTRRLLTTHCLAVGLFASAFVASTATAQEVAPTASSQAGERCDPPRGADAERAERLFRQAQRHLHARRPEPAIALLEEILAVHDSPNVRLVLGLAWDDAGRPARAWEELTRASEHAAGCPRYRRTARESEAARTRLSSRIGLVRVVTRAIEARVRVRDGNGHETERLPGELAAVAPGLVELVVDAPGRQSWREVVQVEGGETRAVEATLLRPSLEASRATAPRATDSIEPVVESPRVAARRAAWTLAALSVASAVVGAVAWGRSRGLHRDAARQCTDALCPGDERFSDQLDRGERLERAGVVLLGISVAVAIGATGAGVAARRGEPR